MLACRCGQRQKSVCTYTTSLVPTTETKELRDVLEVSWPGVVDHGTEGGIAVAIEARDGLGDRTLRRIARLRRGAVRGALGLPLSFGVLLRWTGHFEVCVMSALIGEEQEMRCSHRSALHASRHDGEPRRMRITYLDEKTGASMAFEQRDRWSELRRVSKAARKFRPAHLCDCGRGNQARIRVR
jgi:hypothetical protein